MPDFIRFDAQESSVIGASIAEDDACRLIYITNGNGTMTAGDKIISFGSRDVFILPPRTRLEIESNGGYKRIMFRIKNADATGQFENTIIARDNHTHDVYTMLMMLQRECIADISAHAEYISRLVQLIFLLISTLSIHESDRPYVERIERLLVNNVENSAFELDSIYSTAPQLTKDYVRRIFKQKTGCTPKLYLNRLRIEKAKEMLSDTDNNYNVKITAAACGFNDQYYFSRMFKQMTGVSPAHWKKRSYFSQLMK